MTDAKPPTFSPLTLAEEKWLAAHVAEAPGLVAAFVGTPPAGPPDASALDATWRAWIETAAQDADAINTVINVLGVAFGEILVRELGFEWTIATDEFGTDLAARALPGRGDVLVYPANFVAKRWERREPQFFVEGLEQIRRTLGAFERPR